MTSEIVIILPAVVIMEVIVRILTKQNAAVPTVIAEGIQG